ncbi:MAG: rod shape-determining protein RodA [Deferribacteraceae bacterium]|jgi:rod shape determining protein RodA|nr:rod shape-determining protein RodA [Deferribacteraceae bacterium]
MLQDIKNIFKRSDYFLLLIVMIMAVISYFAIYSAVYDTTTGLVRGNAARQLKIFGFGLIIFFAVSFIGYKRFVRFAIPLYIIGCLALVLVILKGDVGMGARRWIFGVQPSEFFKFVWVVMLGWVFMDLEAQSIGFFKLLKKLVWLLPPFGLVFLQPDLGTAMTYIAVWGIVVAFLGVRKEIVALFVILCMFAAPVMWNKMANYQRMRVISFLAPDKYSGGGGYQARQSKIAIGSGGLTGKGYLKGTQAHLKFMPERHTDFIFSVINEERGFAGGIAVIALFLLLLSRVMMTAVQFKEARGKVVCVAVGGFILFQFYINVSMTMGIAPVVGVPLPLISYGGSSLVTYMAMLGLVNSVYIYKDTPMEV